MIIPKDNLEIDLSKEKSILFKGGLLKIRLMLNPQNKNEILVQEVDALNNVRSSETFTGFDGFWKAVNLFEKKVEDAMGWKEVFGFEVGMVIKLEKDTKKYPKGTYLLITEVDSNGKASKYQKLNDSQVKKISKNKYITKLTKAIGLDDLIGKGISSVSDLKVDKEYDFNLEPQSQIIIPTNMDIDGFWIGQKVKIYDETGGGDGTIEQLVLLTNADKKTKLYANIRFEDHSLGMIPLSDTIKEKNKTTQNKKEKTLKEASVSESNTNDLNELPSTDSRVWGSEFEKGDLVKVRNDYKSTTSKSKFLKGSTMWVESINIISEAKRPENPSGKLYNLDNGETWEGKDLIKVF
jgi:hypothetical protein